MKDANIVNKRRGVEAYPTLSVGQVPIVLYSGISTK